MKTNTETVTRDDLMGITMAVLMFMLQGCMVLAMSTDYLVAAETTAMHGMVIATHTESTGPSGLPV